MGTCVLSQTQPDKQRFLRAVEILSHAVHAQANGTMDEYFPKAVLAKKIEVRGSRSAGVPGAVGGVSPGGLRAPLWLFQMLILEEASELLTSNVRQQAMLCVVALRSLPAAPASGPGLSGAQTFGVGGRETSGPRAADPGDCHLIRQRPGAAGCPPAPRRCGEGSQEVADPPGEGAWVAAAAGGALADAAPRAARSPRSQVHPPFSLSQKLDLVNVGVARVFALPHARPSVDEKDSASLYAQVGPRPLPLGTPWGRGAAPGAGPPSLAGGPHLSPRGAGRVPRPCPAPFLRAHDALRLESRGSVDKAHKLCAVPGQGPARPARVPVLEWESLV